MSILIDLKHTFYIISIQFKVPVSHGFLRVVVIFQKNYFLILIGSATFCMFSLKLSKCKNISKVIFFKCIHIQQLIQMLISLNVLLVYVKSTDHFERGNA